MRHLIKFGIQQSVSLNITFVALLLFGIYVAIPSLPIDRYPNINMGEVTVSTSYPGATAVDVERLVTDKIEESIRDMKGIEYVSSTSLSEHSNILIKFIDDLDYKALYDELRLRVLGIQNTLPIVNGDPLYPTFHISNVDEWLPVMQINLMYSDNARASKRPLTLIAKNLRSRLEAIEYVKEVKLIGEETVQYDLYLLPEKLNKYGITILEISDKISQSIQSLPGGSYDSELGERHIVLNNVPDNSNDIYNIVVRSEGLGAGLLLSEFIDFNKTGIKRLRGGISSSVNGYDSVSCKILKEVMGNSETVKAKALEKVDSFFMELNDPELSYKISLDSTVMIRDSLGVLQHSLLAACVLVVLALFWFLTRAKRSVMLFGTFLGVLTGLSFIFIEERFIKIMVLSVFLMFVFAVSRAAILTVSGIVFSFIGSLIVFYLLEISLNEITLLGFVLTVGIIVDDAIVVLENIRRHREIGSPMLKAAIDGTAEVFWPVVSATLTTIAAFLPMLMMTGSTGEFFSLVPIAVTIALGISLFECLIILPLHVVELQKVLGDENLERSHDDHYSSFLKKSGFLGYLHRKYDGLLNFCLNHAFLSCSCIVFLFCVSMGLLWISVPQNANDLNITPPLKIEFFPDDPSQCWVTLRMPEGSSLAITDGKAREISRYLIGLGEGYIRCVTTQAGMSIDKGFKPVRGHNFAFLQIELANRAEREFEDGMQYIKVLRKKVEEKFEKEGIDISVQAMQGGPPTGADVNVRVYGLNEQNVEQLAKDLFAWMNSETGEEGELKGVIDLTHNRQQKIHQLKFQVDDNSATTLGLDVLTIQKHVSILYDGAYVGKYRQSDKDIPIKLKISGDQGALLNLPIKGDVAKNVYYRDIGSLEYLNVPDRLVKRDFVRSIIITGSLEDNAIYSNEPILKWYHDNSNKYKGVSLSFGGEAESTTRSYNSLILAFGLAVFLIYVILASQFKSYIQPFIIMSNIVFSLIGVVIVMSIFGFLAQMLGSDVIRPERSWFTVQCFMAVVGLSGLVVNDAIVLIDFINQRRREGYDLRDALKMAGHQRMRPILMTTITTIAGLIPMSIGLPEFSMNWSPFATAFVAGLTISTLMTLLIIPVIYELIEKFVTYNLKLFKVIFPHLQVNKT